MSEQSASEANAWATNNGVLRAALVRTTAERAEARSDLARMTSAMEKCRAAVKVLTYMRGIPADLDPGSRVVAWREHVREAREGAIAALAIIDAALK